MTCLTWLPFGCTSVAATVVRSTARPARWMGDSCRQVSWLTARASLSNLPSSPVRIASGIRGKKLAAHSCGRSRGFDPEASPRSLDRHATYLRLSEPYLSMPKYFQPASAHPPRCICHRRCTSLGPPPSRCSAHSLRHRLRPRPNAPAASARLRSNHRVSSQQQHAVAADDRVLTSVILVDLACDLAPPYARGQVQWLNPSLLLARRGRVLP